MQHTRLGLAGALCAIALIAGCTNSETREAAPAEISALEISESGDSEDASATTSSPSRTCDPNGACAVGDIGPGGGIVVFDAGSAQPWGRYLEIAPVGWAGSAKDPQGTWCPKSSARFGTDIGTGRDLGRGAANTAAIITACGTETAAGIAAAYQGGGKSDWFLPSMNELNKAWQQRSRSPILPDDGARYWTSSQAEVDIPLAIKLAIEFTNGNPDSGGTGFYRSAMENQRHIRPMRAF